MTAENLVREVERVEPVDTSFPDTWVQGDQQLALSYRFEPGAADDGVTVQVPLALLAGLRPDGFDWQVPGLREDLVTALIKALPKAIRRNVVPAADWAKRLLSELDDAETLTDALARAIQRLTRVPVTAGDFDLERVPAHLRPTFAVMDERGLVVATGKDLAVLQLQLKSTARESVARASVAPTNALERNGITTWNFDELPRVIDTRQGSNTIRAYPALVDDGASAAIRLMSTPADQAREQRAGVRRLLQLAIPSPAGYVQEHLTTAEKLSLAHSPYRTTADLFTDCLVACIDAVIGDREIFTRDEFEAVRDAVSATLLDEMFRTVSLVSTILIAAREVEKAITAASSVALLSPLADTREQLGDLVSAGFVSATGLAQLRRLPVYLKGILHRLGTLADNVGRDRVWMSEVRTATERYREAGGTLPLTPDATPRIRRARWLLEELRLSLFAQQLGTSEAVSLQRIVKALAG
jgi:ATP-dependent helicase HrpA